MVGAFHHDCAGASTFRMWPGDCHLVSACRRGVDVGLLVRVWCAHMCAGNNNNNINNNTYFPYSLRYWLLPPHSQAMGVYPFTQPQT